MKRLRSSCKTWFAGIECRTRKYGNNEHEREICIDLYTNYHISEICASPTQRLTLRVYAEQGAVKWAQENPNALELYRYGEPRQTLTRGQGYLSHAAAASTRIPTGHPEGYLEAFATIYVGVVEAIRRYIDGDAMKTEAYDFPTVYDGLRGMQFIYKAVESCENGSTWVSM